jgi:hypothetical protein
MEALSPRSTNQMIKPKPVMDRKMGDRHDKHAAGAAPKPLTSKNHADPPPSIVTEPEDGSERYSIGAFLGKGGFAVCYEGTLARNNRVFAMKVVKSHMPQKKMEEKVSLTGTEALQKWHANDDCSFERSSKSIPRCVTPLLSSSSAHSHSAKAHMWSSSCVRTAQ